MLGGFDPRSREVSFRRRRGRALACALLVYGLSVALAYRLQSGAETEVEVELQPEIQDFAVDEEEPEPEIVEEPPPPPPDAKVKVVQRPKPRPKLAPPETKVTEAADESSRAKTVVLAGRTDALHRLRRDRSRRRRRLVRADPDARAALATVTALLRPARVHHRPLTASDGRADRRADCRFPPTTKWSAPLPRHPRWVTAPPVGVTKCSLA